METLKRIPWPAFTILFLVVASHLNSLPGSFHYDDNHSIVANEHIFSNEIWKRLWYDYSVFSTETNKGMYRPLVVFSYALTIFFAGLNSFAFILTNVIVHACVSLTILTLVRHLYFSGYLAWLSSAVFALHPINTQVNNYISSRSESMAALGVLLSLLCFNRSYIFFGIISYLGGLASKSQALIALPFYLLLLGKEFLKKHVLAVALIITVTIAYVLFLIFSGFLPASLSQEVREYHVQLFTQLKAIVYYLLLFITPFNLSIEHAFVESRSFLQSPTLLAFLFLISSLVFLFKNRSIFVIGSSFFLISMIITFVIPLNVVINEHRLYLGCGGLALCMAGALERSRYKKYLSVIYIVCLFSLSWQRNSVWKDDFSLWQDAVGKAPASFRAQSNWGLALFSEGHVDEAVASLRLALEINPKYARTWNNLGLALSAQGKINEAHNAFEHAIDLNPDMIGFYANWGQLFIREGRYGEAIAVLNEALSIDSISSKIHVNLGVAHQQAGRAELAVKHYQTALLTSELAAEVLNNLGLAQQDLGRIEKAEKSFLRAIKLRPYDVLPQINLRVLRGRKSGKNTLEIYEEISKTYWNSVEVWRILAVEWTRIAEYSKALYAYTRVLEIDAGDETAIAKKAYLKSLIIDSSD
ncbi:MAG: tetratricopeptide repeat protein [Candidatus Latescibacterota bacterium]|nr:tetratricopeptide repeat protein [Candidatus Latescibacterota bacterium]